MLQIDHVYEFFSTSLFRNGMLYSLPGGIFPNQLNSNNIHVFNDAETEYQFFFNDQEPFLDKISTQLLDSFKASACDTQHTFTRLINLAVKQNLIDTNILNDSTLVSQAIYDLHSNSQIIKLCAVTSEKSKFTNNFLKSRGFFSLYYFFHGFAALDWYRGYYALNYTKSVIKDYHHDYVSYNRIINNDRSYRIYWVSKLAELGLLPNGQISFNVTDNQFDDWRDEVADPNTKLSEHARQHAERYLTNINRLVIDKAELPGSASADIPREVDSLWNIVTETVFYYDKLHLTEKIFKPIVSKQPFMLIAAPGNLEYLRSYGFKTFEGIIDESYDNIQDNDQRIDAVAEQLRWYCNLSKEEKSRVIERLAPIVDYNFHHFYGAFKHVITKELLNNTKTLFKQIGYDDSGIDYTLIYQILTK